MSNSRDRREVFGLPRSPERRHRRQRRNKTPRSRGFDYAGVRGSRASSREVLRKSARRPRGQRIPVLGSDLAAAYAWPDALVGPRAPPAMRSSRAYEYRYASIALAGGPLGTGCLVHSGTTASESPMPRIRPCQLALAICSISLLRHRPRGSPFSYRLGDSLSDRVISPSSKVAAGSSFTIIPIRSGLSCLRSDLPGPSPATTSLLAVRGQAFSASSLRPIRPNDKSTKIGAYRGGRSACAVYDVGGANDLSATSEPYRPTSFIRPSTWEHCDRRRAAAAQLQLQAADGAAASPCWPAVAPRRARRSEPIKALPACTSTASSTRFVGQDRHHPGGRSAS